MLETKPDFATLVRPAFLPSLRWRVWTLPLYLSSLEPLNPPPPPSSPPASTFHLHVWAGGVRGPVALLQSDSVITDSAVVFLTKDVWPSGTISTLRFGSSRKATRTRHNTVRKQTLPDTTRDLLAKSDTDLTREQPCSLTHRHIIDIARPRSHNRLRAHPNRPHGGRR